MECYYFLTDVSYFRTDRLASQITTVMLFESYMEHNNKSFLPSNTVLVKVINGRNDDQFIRLTLRNFGL